MTARKVGELNGKWAFLFKLSLIAVNAILGLQIWLVASTYKMQTDLAVLEQRVSVIEKKVWRW